MSETPEERWERAYKSVNRTPEAEAQIEAAHAPPSAMEEAMQEIDRAVDFAECGHAVAFDDARPVEPSSRDDIVMAPTPSGALLLTGPRAIAYLALEAASKRALETQTAHVQASADLRTAIEAMCRAMAPVKDGA